MDEGNFTISSWILSIAEAGNGPAGDNQLFIVPFSVSHSVASHSLFLFIAFSQFFVLSFVGVML